MQLTDKITLTAGEIIAILNAYDAGDVGLYVDPFYEQALKTGKIEDQTDKTLIVNRSNNA
jgi:hypothetical protein